VTGWTERCTDNINIFNITSFPAGRVWGGLSRRKIPRERNQRTDFKTELMGNRVIIQQGTGRHTKADADQAETKVSNGYQKRV
jgi:hypothetical protein